MALTEEARPIHSSSLSHTLGQLEHTQRNTQLSPWLLRNSLLPPLPSTRMGLHPAYSLGFPLRKGPHGGKKLLNPFTPSSGLPGSADSVSVWGPLHALFPLAPLAAVSPWPGHASMSQGQLEPQPFGNTISFPHLLGAWLLFLI